MTIAFKQAHSGNYRRAARGKEDIRYLVIHFTANDGDTAKNNADYFARAEISTSAHYFVDENEVWQSVRDADIAWHCGTRGVYFHPYCRNANSIGIELCSRKNGEKFYFMPETVRRAQALIFVALAGGSVCRLPGLLPEGMFLCVTDTRGSHSELTGEFATIRQEMEQVAACFGKPLLGQVQETAFWAALPALRSRCGDRAVLRAIHYFEENARTLAQREALYARRFPVFAELVKQSGQASFALCQNVYCTADVRHQGLSVALALSQSILEGTEGAWRMQGGGFAGTIQAYVPGRLLGRYHTAIERVFGQGSCYVLRLREQGAVRVI